MDTVKIALAEQVKSLYEENQQLKERETPLPTTVQMISTIDIHHCPKCEEILVRVFNYCPFCGQRVKFTEVDLSAKKEDDE